MNPPSLASSIRHRLSQYRRADASTQTEEVGDVTSNSMERATNLLIGTGYSPCVSETQNNCAVSEKAFDSHSQSFPVALDTFSNLLDDDLAEPSFSPSNDISLIDLGHCDDFLGPDSIMTDDTHSSSWRLSSR
ncbi:hypothetical protein KIN20_001614 [Parelaphostrongylus tenuis]|uniref:Uncharacterized protein n=1 Tax=Parelaphostrongylus tenuis TaxID=148309 RepID=A0AAD5QCR6_PARTN|nr:hypothetical protein KIN20_001614 [Parelaphostrongylus tenuis]